MALEIQLRIIKIGWRLFLLKIHFTILKESFLQTFQNDMYNH